MVSVSVNGAIGLNSLRRWCWHKVFVVVRPAFQAENVLYAEGVRTALKDLCRALSSAPFSQAKTERERAREDSVTSFYFTHSWLRMSEGRKPWNLILFRVYSLKWMWAYICGVGLISSHRKVVYTYIWYAQRVCPRQCHRQEEELDNFLFLSYLSFHCVLMDLKFSGRNAVRHL